MKIFISHSSRDKWAARRISKEIEELGATTFLDEKDIETGESIDDAVSTHLKDCDELLMLLSPASIKSEWVLIEIGGAKALEKRLIPILFHLGANDIPSPISKNLARDINGIEKYYDELKTRINNGSVSTPPQPVARRSSAKTRTRTTPNFSVGDKVKLPNRRKQDADREKVVISWEEDMDSYLDHEATVTIVDNDKSLKIDIDGEENWWAFEWLTKIT